MAQIRKVLVTYPTSDKCILKIEELNNLYKRKFNRNSNAELFYSYGGTEIKPIHSIMAYYEKDHVKEVEFFEGEVNK